MFLPVDALLTLMRNIKERRPFSVSGLKNNDIAKPEVVNLLNSLRVFDPSLPVPEGDDPESHGALLLHYAFKYITNPRYLKAILELYPNELKLVEALKLTDQNGNTPFHYACCNATLINFGDVPVEIEEEKVGEAPNDSPEIEEHDEGVGDDSKGHDPIATVNWLPEEVSGLTLRYFLQLSGKFDINLLGITNKDGLTPLHLLMYSENGLSIAKNWLYEFISLDINRAKLIIKSIPKSGMELLHLAASSKSNHAWLVTQQIVACLGDEARSLVRQKGKCGDYEATPIHMAARNKDVRVMDSLLSCLSDEQKIAEIFDHEDSQNQSPFIIALSCLPDMVPPDVSDTAQPAEEIKEAEPIANEAGRLINQAENLVQDDEDLGQVAVQLLPSSVLELMFSHLTIEKLIDIIEQSPAKNAENFIEELKRSRSQSCENIIYKLDTYFIRKCFVSKPNMTKQFDLSGLRERVNPSGVEQKSGADDMGAFGGVMTVRRESDGVRYKIKYLRDERNRSMFENEMRIHAGLVSDYIIEYVGRVKLDNLTYMVLNFACYGSLFDIFHDNTKVEESKVDAYPDDPVPPDEKFRLAFQLIKAVSYLHGENIVHRDIKPHNVLIDKNKTVRLCDFGLAAQLDEANPMCSVKIAGTPLWMAPETLKRNAKYTYACDLYALGLVIAGMITEKLPYEDIWQGQYPGDDDISDVILDSSKPPCNLSSDDPGVAAFVSDDQRSTFFSAVNGLLVRNKADRYTFEQVAKIVESVQPNT